MDALLERGQLVPKRSENPLVILFGRRRQVEGQRLIYRSECEKYATVSLASGAAAETQAEGRGMHSNASQLAISLSRRFFS